MAGREVERIRSANRVIVDNLANGERPLSPEEAKQMGLHVNVNWGEGPVLFAQARRQFMNAFERGSRYFRVTIPDAPPDKKFRWEQFISNSINRTMKNCPYWLALGDNWRASVVAHGIGPRAWDNRDDWRPEFVGLDDFRVPTNTLTSFENLDWFARRVWYTEGELVKKVYGTHASKYWNKSAVAQILETIHDYNYDATDYRWINQPEKMAQMVKQNGGYYSSDAVPAVPMWHFYYRGEDPKTEKWHLRVVVDTDLGMTGNQNEFIYDSGDKSHADSLQQLISVQIGDLNNTAPLLYPAVRGLGFLLVEPCFWSNITTCRMIQHLNDQFNTWYRVQDNADRSRALSIETFDRCVLTPGVSVVPQTERHQVNPQLIEMAFAKTKQLQAEASASYTSQSDTGTQKEQTAYETAVKVAQVNAMMSGMMLTAQRQEKYCYREICRRFCRQDTFNSDAKKFQRKAKEFGIPRMYLDVEMWDVEPEMPLGNGNPTMEMSEAQQLLQIRPLHNPKAQQQILNMVDAAITGNAAVAQELAPVDVEPVADDGQKWAASIFGTLMQGVQIPFNEEIPAMQQIDPLMGMLSGAVSLCEQQGNVCTRPQLNGFAMVMNYINALVQQIAQDKSSGPLAKQYSQALGQIANIVKGFAQRLAEEEQASQIDPEQQAKIIQLQQKNQVTLQSKMMKDRQSMAQKQESFEQAQRHKAEAHAIDQQIQSREAALDLERARMETMVDVAKAKVDLATTRAKAEADLQANKKANAESEAA